MSLVVTLFFGFVCISSMYASLARHDYRVPDTTSVSVRYGANQHDVPFSMGNASKTFRVSYNYELQCISRSLQTERSNEHLQHHSFLVFVAAVVVQSDSFHSMPPQRLCNTKSGTTVGDREVIPSFLLRSRHTMRCCLKHINYCATALGEFFPSTADRPPRLE